MAPTKKALVLSGGGGRGAYHIGVIEELVRQGWMADGRGPDIIAGTSIGAINAAAGFRADGRAARGPLAGHAYGGGASPVELPTRGRAATIELYPAQRADLRSARRRARDTARRGPRPERRGAVHPPLASFSRAP